MRRLAMVVLLGVLAAGCSSAHEVFGPAPSTTTVPKAVPNPLARALRALGVDVDAAPPAALRLDAARLCGTERGGLVAGRRINGPARRCFLDDNRARRPSVFVMAQSSVEGDPIVTIYRSTAAGHVELFVDATRDKFGSGKWEHGTCTGLTTEFPNAPEPLPADYFDGTGCAPVAPLAD